MSTASLRFEFANYCPHLACGELLEDKVAHSSKFCVYCGSGVISCSTCQATNRLFAVYCRGCGERLTTEVCPLQNGLRASEIELASMQSIEQPQSPIPFRLGGAVLAHLVAASGIIVVSLQEGSIVLLSEFQRQELGRIAVSGAIDFTPVLQDGLLYVAAGRSVLAFDLAKFLDQPSRSNAIPEWSFEIEGGAITQPLLASKTLLYLTTRDSAHTILDAVMLEDGKKIWAQPLRFNTSQTAPPVLINKHILLFTLAGEAHLIDAIEGRLIESLSLRQTVDLQVQPFVTQDRVLFADTDGNIWEIVLREGAPLLNLLYSNQARITALSASKDFITFGHIAGLTLLNSRGHLVWSSDSLDAISFAPLIAGKSVFALDDRGNALLFDELKANPLHKVKLLAGEINTPPLITRAKIIVVNAIGELVAINWR
jgi:hypothetical protein